MPLLGRHKSLPGTSQRQQAAGSQAAPVCESPLFGTRRQLPLATGLSGTQPAGTSEKPAPGTRHHRPSLSAKNSSAPAPPAGQLEAPHTLASIPKQITRQQIHYAFSIMDTNSDGLVDPRDLGQMLANLGVPIDEAILSHVMSGVSKRGEHRISESEFLDWMGNFIQVTESQAEPATSDGAGGQQRRRRPLGSARGSESPRATGRLGRASATSTGSIVRSASSGSASALVAQSEEEQRLIGLQMRQRRGSSSGLAMMARVGSSQQSETAAAATKTSALKQQAHERSGSESAGGEGRGQQALAEQQQEARADLKAAFCVFDLDGDGFITLDEVQKGLKLLGESWSLAELNQLLFSKCGQPQPTTRPSASKRSAGKAEQANQRQQRISIDDFVKLLL